MRYTDRMFHKAKQYRDRGYSVIPLSGKKPVIEWKPYMEQRATVGNLRQWFGFETRHNIGIVTGAISNLVVIDFDEKDSARAFYARHRDIITTVVETRRGAHFYFSHSGQQIRNSTGEYDVRGDGGYVVAPPSVVKDWQYKFVREDELKPFPDFVNPKNVDCKHHCKRVSNGAKYILHIHSVAGQRGHDNCFRAACALRDSGMSEAEALAALIEWNEHNAEPPWTLRELTHKVTDVYRR